MPVVVASGFGVLFPVASVLARMPGGSVGGCLRGRGLSLMAIVAGTVA